MVSPAFDEHSGLKGKLDKLEARKSELEVELATLEPVTPRFHPSLAKVYADKVAQLDDALRNDSTRDEALTILRPLIDSVTVTTAADGGFDINITGAIAAMVDMALAPNAKNRPRGGGGSRTVPEFGKSGYGGPHTPRVDIGDVRVTGISPRPIKWPKMPHSVVYAPRIATGRRSLFFA